MVYNNFLLRLLFSILFIISYFIISTINFNLVFYLILLIYLAVFIEIYIYFKIYKLFPIIYIIISFLFLLTIDFNDKNFSNILFKILSCKTYKQESIKEDIDKSLDGVKKFNEVKSSILKQFS